MNQKLLAGAASLAVAPFIVANSAAAISLNFITPLTVEVEEQVDIGIAISGLGNGIAPSLGGFDFKINFDSSILSFNSVTFGDPVLGNQLDLDPDGFELIDIVDDSLSNIGTVNLFELSGDSDTVLDTTQPDAFTLAVLSFDAVAPGTSNLNFSLNQLILSDALGNPLDLSTIALNNSSVEVEPVVATSVPESSTAIALFALGLLSS